MKMKAGKKKSLLQKAREVKARGGRYASSQNLFRERLTKRWMIDYIRKNKITGRLKKALTDLTVESDSKKESNLGRCFYREYYEQTRKDGSVVTIDRPRQGFTFATSWTREEVGLLVKPVALLALKASSPVVREEACVVLGSYKMRSLKPVLERALHSSRWDSSGAAAAFDEIEVYFDLKPKVKEKLDFFRGSYPREWSGWGKATRGLISYLIATDAKFREKLPAGGQDARDKLEYLNAFVRQAKERDYPDVWDILIGKGKWK